MKSFEEMDAELRKAISSINAKSSHLRNKNHFSQVAIAEKSKFENCLQLIKAAAAILDGIDFELVDKNNEIF